MDPHQSGLMAEQKAEHDTRMSQISASDTAKAASAKPKSKTLGQRWSAVQLSKSSILGICLAMIIGTMLVGFTWGGWVTDGAAQRAATTMANDAVVNRLSSICVAQFQQDPVKEQKLVELKAASSYQRGNYVKDQGWAIMPGDEVSDTKVATACGKVLAQME